MEHYAHKSDCSIERNHPGYLGSAMLMDLDGNVLYGFSSDWTDEQIFTALSFANKAFIVGVRRGRAAKAAEIRTALEGA